jgi:hypothetical protein
LGHFTYLRVFEWVGMRQRSDRVLDPMVLDNLGPLL